jgi:hypothetical protein
MIGVWHASSGFATPMLAVGGPGISRRAAQRVARQELAEMSTWQRIVQWIGRLFAATGNAVPGGWLGLIVLALLAVLAISVVLFWVRPTGSRRDRAGSVLTTRARTALDYRRAAERRAAAGDYSGAIVERVRAIAAELDERGILLPRPGRTADELAFEAGRQLPALADDLRAATRLFDDIRYGEREGTQQGYQLVSRIDIDVRTARLSSSAAQQAGAGSGVPR